MHAGCFAQTGIPSCHESLRKMSLPTPSSSDKECAPNVLNPLVDESGGPAAPTTNFDQIATAQAPSGTEVTLYKSKETGLSVFIANAQTSLVRILSIPFTELQVYGYFTLATEIVNDSGCPHTLEHLVFLGSEKYRYKGFLDKIANRSFADGTNAWTDINHTAYTVCTAGLEGFLQILPPYIDHLLYPTITDAAFTTEVHHKYYVGFDVVNHGAGPLC
jgi:Insulinase (Peptidase family M16)